MATQPLPGSSLSHGEAIEYKAFARSFGDVGAVLSLVATCAYPTGGFSIYFQGSGVGQFDLMETSPHGPVSQLVTYYLASWTSGQRLAEPPTHVKIRDASGETKVKVEPWD